MLQMNDANQLGKSLVIFAERIVNCKVDEKVKKNVECMIFYRTIRGIFEVLQTTCKVQFSFYI